MHMQRDEETDRLGSDASAAWSRVAALASSVDASLDRWLSDTYRVGLTEFRALTFVSQSAEKELRVSDLAQRVGLNQSSATRLVSRLETKGYAQRDVCQDDGRGVYAVITERGESLLRDVQSPYEDRIVELLSNSETHFPTMDTRQLGTALRQTEALLAPRPKN